MNKTAVQIAAFAAVIGAFILVGAFSEQLGDALVGLLGIGAGIVVVFFRTELATLQRRMAETRFAPDRWSSAQPSTYMLWGVLVSVLGAIAVLHAYGYA